jgi:hypothetical protein
LEQRTPTTTLTGLVSPLGDTAQVSPLAESMGIAYVDCTLVNGPDGGGIFR